MVIGQGEVWWADLAEPIGPAPGYRPPVVVVQSESEKSQTDRWKPSFRVSTW
jgi:mRNA-degrading endonuclease toxin of MazEF toxin-antitoxin module